MTLRPTLVRPTLVPVGSAYNTGHGLSFRYRLLETVIKQHRQAGGVKSGSQTARVLRDNQFFAGWDHHRRTGTFVDETRFAEAGRQLRRGRLKAQRTPSLPRDSSEPSRCFHRYRR